MRILKIIIMGSFLFLTGVILSQETFPTNGVLDNRVESYALTNATAVVNAQKTIQNATILIREGIIENIGSGLSIPLGYTKIDLKGKYVYPSFIDLHTSYGIPKEERRTGSGGFGFASREQIQSNTKGAYNANEAIKSHYNASEHFTKNEKMAEEMRKIGFGAVLSFKEDGIARGSSVFATLGADTDNEVVLKERAAAHYSFNRGSSRQNYPRSMMGYISLLRQTYLDADWFGRQNPRPFTDQSLEAWLELQNLPQIFDARSWINALRADKIGDEFGINYIIRGGGDSYKRIKEIKACGTNLVVPVNYPDAFDVEDPIDAEGVSLADMKHWELAPGNAAHLEANNIVFAFTTSGLKKKDDFIGNIRKAIKHGLSKEMALRAITEIPARLIKMENHIGSLKKGMIANFLITSGELFEESTSIHENWIQGKPHRYKDLDMPDHNGKYVLDMGNDKYNVEINGKPGSYKAKVVVDDSTSWEAKVKFSKEFLSLNFKPSKQSMGEIRLSGWSVENGWEGTGQMIDGEWFDWTARKTAEIEKKENPNKTGQGQKKEEKAGEIIFPFLAYGNKEIPKQQTILIKNATVWTNEDEGVLENTDVLLKDGKISNIGRNLNNKDALIIDATNKHLTSGIIDEHTHIAGGGNDMATNSSMVRIGDQVNSEDINIYRALSGGVTAAQVLHGSANPIGGQSALIKLRWGAAPEDLKIKRADEFIKFALGENVKRSSNPQSIRFPQTRMGVEQVYVDAFTNALEYEKKWKAFSVKKNANGSEKSKIKPRRDLVHEAMLEIINGERFITCHSYVQSEINMLMKVAEQFNFRVNTFTHILEGYKVADKMAKHGAGASSFSDWWNYKWEVRYAIPYNAAIMHRAGVVTALNSDNAEMGRRLNQEAAKAIKYGGISEQDALKMVTLNPARLLHLEDRMGSIKPGKDADVVLWTDHPLSVYARAEKTIVDGTVYYDLLKDEAKQVELRKERARLIQKMKGAKKSGAPTSRRMSSIDMEVHCESVLFEDNEHQH